MVLGERPLIAHVIDRLAPQVAGMAINATPDPALDEFGLPVLPDEVPGRGPLGGIHAAMDWAARSGEVRVMTVSVDTPFLPFDLVQRLSASRARAAVAATADGLHATTGLWSVDLQPLAAGGARRGRAQGAGLDRLHRGGGGPVRRRLRVSERQHGRGSAAGRSAAAAVSGFDTIVVADWSARSVPSAARPSKDAIFLGICRDRHVATLYQRTRSQAMRSLSGLIDGEIRAGRRILVACDFPFAYPRGFARSVTGEDDPLALWAVLAREIEDDDRNGKQPFRRRGAVQSWFRG